MKLTCGSLLLRIFKLSLQVEYFLRIIAERLPIKAIPVSQEDIEQIRIGEKKLEEANTNEYTLKYIYQNKMMGSREWMRDGDKKYFGRYQ